MRAKEIGEYLILSLPIQYVQDVNEAHANSFMKNSEEQNESVIYYIGTPRESTPEAKMVGVYYREKTESEKRLKTNI